MLHPLGPSPALQSIQHPSALPSRDAWNPAPLARNTAEHGMLCRAERKAAAAAARPQELHEEWRKFRIQPARRARWKRCIAAAQLAIDPSQDGNQCARTTLLQASWQNIAVHSAQNAAWVRARCVCLRCMADLALPGAMPYPACDCTIWRYNQGGDSMWLCDDSMRLYR